MNQAVRKYLIERARQGKPVYYSDLNRDCQLGFDLGHPGDNQKFSNMLGEVSTYENQHKRPLITAMATYSPNSPGYQQDIHGDGFYRLSASLGKGDFETLKAKGFGIEEMNNCINYWQNDNHFNQYYELLTGGNVVTRPPFFNSDEVHLFHRWANQPYDKQNPEHLAAKTYLMETVWAKTQYWSEEIVKQVSGLETFNRRTWGQPGWEAGQQVSRFKPYTWARIYRAGDLKKDIFFTVGVEATSKTLLYKLDYYFEKGGNLNEEQKNTINTVIPKDIRWLTINLDELPNWDWERLIELTVKFVKANLPVYDRLVRAVWGGETPIEVFSNCLIEHPVPEGGITELPKLNYSFKGTDTDLRAQQQELQLLGDAGEQLVLLWEKERLKDYPSLAAGVHKVKDGKGYDILSYTEAGDEIYIEVKTTTGNAKTPFEISANEIAFSKQNAGQYRLYRLFDYQEDFNRANFFVLNDLDDQVLFQPVTFTAYLKKE